MNSQIPTVPVHQHPTAEAPPHYTFYVLVRTDIPVAQQLVQAVHAAAEAGRSHYAAEHGIASAIVLKVATQAELLEAAARLEKFGLAVALFHEPDFGMGASALASAPVLPAQRCLFRQWPLWRPPVPSPER